MHFRFSSAMPVQASQSVVEPEGLYQDIIGFSDFFFGSAAVIGASAFDPLSQLHCPDQIGFAADLRRDICICHTDAVRFMGIASAKGWQIIHFRQYSGTVIALRGLTGIKSLQKIKLGHDCHLIFLL